ncbi:MAG: hypothetical protein PWP23_1461 [Candidatus Sumerlaeota bacterium]|nr:hypothetical protein [Candidatus Sumerlaeota bacterium]
MTRIEPGPGLDPPPAFGPLARRLDPLLAAEDTNVLYRAFRIRRTVHRRGTWQQFLENMRTGHFNPLAPGTVRVVFPVVCTVLSLVMFPFVGWKAPILFGTLLAIVAVVALTKNETGALPRRVGSIFGNRKAAHPARFDVWMLGRPAGEIIEAIYLESSEGNLRVASIVILGTALLIARETFKAESAGSPAHVFFLFALGVMAFEAVLILHHVVGAIIIGNLNAFLNHWYLQADFRRYARKSVRRAGEGCLASVSIMVILVAFLPLVGGLVVLVLIGLNRNPALSALIREFFTGLGGWNTSSILLLLTAGGLEASRSNSIRQHVRLFGHMKRRAEFLYHAYMSVVASKDPDGLRWALETYGEPLEAMPPKLKSPLRT